MQLLNLQGLMMILYECSHILLIGRFTALLSVIFKITLKKIRNTNSCFMFYDFVCVCFNIN